MSDVIQLLPDHIANQIAAGEVIQRPASAVKELLENAVDAGATNIQLHVMDAGKQLLQVIDNGKGMSETDARMSFERHATSKIKTIDDLFHIRTMGFRGEALASIAAVAQVELKTKRAEDETGTYIEIEDSVVRKQEPVAFVNGTSISMKNLFFNVPARRNFLKTNASELRHIVDEFIRVALAFPQIFFSLSSNGSEMFHLETGNLKQRVLQVLGNHYNTKLVQVGEDTDYMNVSGFVGKPETAKKTRGDQYFFVNSRFIKSPYLQHAVNSAFQDMIAKDSFPAFVLFIDLDPAQVDINVHPTKQEIKFEDEKIVYAFIQSAVKHALAQFSIAPSLDFSLNPEIQQLDAVAKPFTDQQQSAASGSSLFKTFTQKHQAHAVNPTAKSDLQNWRDVYQIQDRVSTNKEPQFTIQSSKGNDDVYFDSPASLGVSKRIEVAESAQLLQLMNSYIVAPVEGSFLLINQQAAHERVLYERYQKALSDKPMASQKSMFPMTIELGAADSVLLDDMMDELTQLGYMIEHFGKDTFVIHGTPADVESGNEKKVIEGLLEQYKHFVSDIRFGKREKIVRTMAWQHSIKQGKILGQKEMQTLVQTLFACDTPNVTADGKPTYIEFKETQLERMFGR
jgi:DNA mismatch repair protein MutL